MASTHRPAHPYSVISAILSSPRDVVQGAPDLNPPTIQAALQKTVQLGLQEGLANTPPPPSLTAEQNITLDTALYGLDKYSTLAEIDEGLDAGGSEPSHLRAILAKTRLGGLVTKAPLLSACMIDLAEDVTKTALVCGAIQARANEKERAVGALSLIVLDTPIVLLEHERYCSTHSSCFEKELFAPSARMAREGALEAGQKYMDDAGPPHARSILQTVSVAPFLRIRPPGNEQEALAITDAIKYCANTKLVDTSHYIESLEPSFQYASESQQLEEWRLSRGHPALRDFLCQLSKGNNSRLSFVTTFVGQYASAYGSGVDRTDTQYERILLNLKKQIVNPELHEIAPWGLTGVGDIAISILFFAHNGASAKPSWETVCRQTHEFSSSAKRACYSEPRWQDAQTYAGEDSAILTERFPKHTATILPSAIALRNDLRDRYFNPTNGWKFAGSIEPQNRPSRITDLPFFTSMEKNAKSLFATRRHGMVQPHGTEWRQLPSKINSSAFPKDSTLQDSIGEHALVTMNDEWIGLSDSSPFRCPTLLRVLSSLIASLGILCNMDLNQTLRVAEFLVQMDTYNTTQFDSIECNYTSAAILIANACNHASYKWMAQDLPRVLVVFISEDNRIEDDIIWAKSETSGKITHGTIPNLRSAPRHQSALEELLRITQDRRTLVFLIDRKLMKICPMWCGIGAESNLTTKPPAVKALGLLSCCLGNK